MAKAAKKATVQVDSKLVTGIGNAAKSAGSANVTIGKLMVNDKTGAADKDIAAAVTAKYPHFAHDKSWYSKRRKVYAVAVMEWKFSESDTAKIASAQFDNLYSVIIGIEAGTVSVKPETVKKIALGKESLARLLPKKAGKKADSVKLNEETCQMLAEEKKEKGVNSWEEAIQALKAENTALKEKVAALEADNAALKERIERVKSQKVAKSSSGRRVATA